MALSDYQNLTDSDNFNWNTVYKQIEKEVKHELTKKERYEYRKRFRDMLQGDKPFNSGIFKDLKSCGFFAENNGNKKLNKFFEKNKNEIASIK